MEEPIVTFLALLLPFIIPTLTAWKHPNWKGILLGALTLWIFLALALTLLLGRYGTEGPGGAIFALWILGGLPISAIYCGGVRALRRARKIN
jgi:hypothetical protein